MIRQLPDLNSRTRLHSNQIDDVRSVTMQAKLVPIEGGATISLDKDMVLIGRNEECEIRLDHKSVSKHHCLLVKTDGLILVRDLGSTNGTRVNGQRIRRAALLPNDQFSVANFKYKVHFGLDENSPEPDELLPPVQRNALPDMLG